MKEGWKLLTLGDIGKVSMCKRILKKQTSEKGDIPFYKIGTFGKTPNAFIPKDVYNEYRLNYSFPKKGDILLSASGTIGRRVIYNGEPAYFQDSNIVWIDNDETKVLNEYLYAFYGYCNWNPSKGATISRLYNDDLRRIKIPLPPLPEQKRIVAILDEAFAGIEKAIQNTEKNLKNAQELFESELNGIFTKQSNSWESSVFGNECSFVRGPFGGSLKKSYFVDKGIAVYEQQHAIYNQFNKIRYFINESKYIEMQRFELKPGDLIMSCSGTMGKVAIVPTNIAKGIINQALLKITPGERIIAEYLKIWMQTSNFQEQLSVRSKGAAIKNVASVKILKEIKLPLPDANTQKSIIRKVKEYKRKVNSLNNILLQKQSMLIDLKQSILQKAFSGDL